MRNILSLWPPGKGLASQLIATFLWILKVCSLGAPLALNLCQLDFLGTVQRHIPSESIAMWQLIGRPNSCPEAKETEYYAFL